ncbi:MAG: TPM domain-containing protein, partial [Rhodospirillaceae bacterium]|nr:TPM domain-containing protein [Rhodospirillaceae bacterium]
RVVDKADILSSTVEAVLETKIEAHEQTTTNQIVIVTLPDLMGRPIEDWGLMLGRDWGIGQAGKDNGIVFLIAPNERELRIEVGYGLEANLPDATAHEIIQSDIIPYFKQGEMEAGITAGLYAILAALEGTYQPAALASGNGSNRSRIGDEYGPFVFLVLWLLAALALSLRRRWNKQRNRYEWYLQSSGGSSGSRSSRSGGGFSGGGGSFGGGGASGRW